MIPRTRPLGTDAKIIRCDRCAIEVMVGGATDEDSTRLIAARSGWRSRDESKGPRPKIRDLCPSCRGEENT